MYQKKVQTPLFHQPYLCRSITSMKKAFVLCSIFLAACVSQRSASTASRTDELVTNGKLFASVYQQRAAEYRALCFQAFNTAHFRLDQLVQHTNGRPAAIITDIDETILDNSAYEVHQTLQGKDYESASWYDWTARAAADTVPGAPYFLHYAASRGVAIFYITNREEQERASTLRNLQRFNLPNADNEHLIPRQPNTSSSKELRRQEVMKNYDVLMLLGDNLADFSALFDKKNEQERLQNTNLSAGEFGSKFIVLPNPVYGDWESALYNYGRLTLAQKDSILKAAAKTY
jgi:5'-nucleotidase (lipoprotein e(P4) family)